MFEREKEFLIEVYLVDCDLVLQVSSLSTIQEVIQLFKVIS